MNKSLYNSTRDLYFPTAVYPDTRRTIKQYRSNIEQGFRINNILAFEDVRDQKNNNFSLNYITRPDMLTNFIELDTLTTTPEVITTKLEFYKDSTQPSQFVYIYDQADSDTVRGIGAQIDDTNSFINNYYFELDVLDDYLLRVKHNDGKYDFFLNWDIEEGERDILFFLRETTTIVNDGREDSSMFRYNIDEFGRVHLFKRYNDDLYVLSLVDSGLTMIQVQSAAGLTVDGSNTIYIDYNFESINATQNNDFISYKARSLNTLSINSDKSLFNEKGQYVFHCEYNDQDVTSNQIKFNFFTLDTNRSEYNFIKRGTNMTSGPDNIPTFKYKTFNAFDTGVDEETGNEKLSLVYTFYDKDIFIQDGGTTTFTAPPSIYPFEKLNINDTTFVKNGAFSGPSPRLADKIYIKQTQDGRYKNGRYLCTWLSSDDPRTPGVWVDRYYYPDVISKEEALNDIPKYITSFSGNIDTEVAYNAKLRSNISSAKFFDKVSDAVITPNCLIKYERVGTSDILDVVQSSSPILSGFNNKITSRVFRVTENSNITDLGSITENICKEEPTDTLTLDGTFYTKLDVYESINRAKAFTVSFDAYIDPNKKYGFELLGNNSNTGFGLFQDMTVTPFLHIVSDNLLCIYNTDGVALNTIQFDSTIRDVLKQSALRDYNVVCVDGSVYRVDLKGNKKKLENVNVEGYISVCMEEDYIYFLMTNNVVKKVDLNTFEIVETLTLGVSDGIAEFDAYKNILNLYWYEGLMVYDGVVYLLPMCDNSLVWETDDIVFYTIKGGDSRDDGTGYLYEQYYLIKHDLKKQPVKFLKSDCPITDIEIEYKSPTNSIFIAIDNQIHEYNTNGVFINIVDYDGGDSGEIEEFGAAGGRILAIDTINEYIEGGVNTNRIIPLFENSEGVLTFGEGSTITTDGTTAITASDYVSTPITNYNILNHIYDSTSLDFRLTLRNSLDEESIERRVISYDTTRIDAGYHTFTFSFDSVQGNASLYVDGLLYQNESFYPGKYNIHNIFSDELFIGSTGFVNGLDLSTYLKQPGYYYINNLTIKNLYIYDTAASTTLAYALDLLNSKIDKLVLSIPHGQRNNKATIERLYRLGRNNSSKKIDVVVNNFGITDKDVLNQIKLNIMNEADSILPAGVDINNIKFST